MSEGYKNLTDKIIELLKRNPGQPVKELAVQLDVNRTFLSGYLKALEDQGYVKLKRIGPAKVYFDNESREVSQKNVKWKESIG